MTARSCLKSHADPAATAYRCSECALELSGLGHKFRRPSLCDHLGELARIVECNSCTGRVALKVYSCPIRGEATLTRSLAGVAAVCDECLHWRPARTAEAGGGNPPSNQRSVESFNRVSPLGTSLRVEGVAAKKPWEYRITAILPHLNTPDYLRVVIELLRLQTEQPYIVVVDTGSPFSVCDELEAMRSDDVEIHFVRGNGYGHASEPVCVALDLGFARANTPLMFLTHTDCFPVRRDALQWLADQCGPEAPVVGWEMSERSWLTDEWQGMVSHTFTMLHSATMRRIGASWHMGRARDQLGIDAGRNTNGWPDTETAFAYCLQDAHVAVKLLGQEVNFQRQTTDWWDHARSYTGTRLYSAGSAQGEATSSYAADALADARDRIRAWSLIGRKRG